MCTRVWQSSLYCQGIFRFTGRITDKTEVVEGLVTPTWQTEAKKKKRKKKARATEEEKNTTAKAKVKTREKAEAAAEATKQNKIK